MKNRSWMLKIPNIIALLGAHPRPDLTRSEVQQVFDLGRSQATDLMRIAGAQVRNGGRTTVDRESLLFYVERCPEAKGFLDEVKRRAKLAQRLREQIEQQRLRAIQIPGEVAMETFQRMATTWADVPHAALEPGRLVIVFEDRASLLQTLMLVCKAIANEPEAIESVQSGGTDAA